MKGSELVSEAILVDQGPVSRTPRSNPALYVEAWDLIRELFAATPGAQAAGLAAPSFSFNGGNGRCDHCQGLGYERVEMQFLSDVFVPCPVCEGKRFKPEVLAIEWNGLSVSSVLEMNVADDSSRLRGLRADPPQALLAGIRGPQATSALGQPFNTLSGGESQGLKLVRYLGALPEEANALLLLDEPTTGSSSPATTSAASSASCMRWSSGATAWS